MPTMSAAIVAARVEPASGAPPNGTTAPPSTAATGPDERTGMRTAATRVAAAMTRSRRSIAGDSGSSLGCPCVTPLPPVLLAHGFASSFEYNWRLPGFADLLEDAGRTVIEFDFPGHGNAPKPHDPAAYDDLAGALGDALPFYSRRRPPCCAALPEDAGRTVIEFDFPGHGNAPKPHDPAAYDDLAGALGDALPAQGQVDAVGFSLGAMTLLRLAARV